MQAVVISATHTDLATELERFNYWSSGCDCSFFELLKSSVGPYEVGTIDSALSGAWAGTSPPSLDIAAVRKIDVFGLAERAGKTPLTGAARFREIVTRSPAFQGPTFEKRWAGIVASQMTRWGKCRAIVLVGGLHRDAMIQQLQKAGIQTTNGDRRFMKKNLLKLVF